MSGDIIYCPGVPNALQHLGQPPQDRITNVPEVENPALWPSLHKVVHFFNHSQNILTSVLSPFHPSDTPVL